jgi:aspartate/glutamate racemase
MPTVGIVGGLGPESTIDYYRRILEAWERVRLVASDQPALIEYLVASVGGSRAPEQTSP